MKLHDVRNKSDARRPRKRVGRGHGSGTGKTSGRGHKGAKSRSGYKHKAAFEGGQMPLVRRIPKRGFSNYPFRKAWAEVNLSQLDRFAAGSTVDPEVLAECGMVKGRFDGIVILGGGELEAALTVKAHRFSKSAVAKIEAAGGSAEVIPLAAGKAEVAAPPASKAEAVEVVPDEVEVAEAAEQVEVADEVDVVEAAEQVEVADEAEIVKAVDDGTEVVEAAAAETEAEEVAGAEDEAGDEDEVPE